jgi:hypothetical protein
MTNLAENKNVRTAALILGGVIVLLLTFCLGVFVGISALGRFPRSHFTIERILGPYFGLTGHGAIGAVTKIENSTLTMMDRLNEQHTINVSANTIMEDDRRHRIRLQDIHVGDRIAVIGSPENGAINARFIRLIGREPSNLPFRLPDPKVPRVQDSRDAD